LQDHKSLIERLREFFQFDVQSRYFGFSLTNGCHDSLSRGPVLNRTYEALKPF